MAVGMPVFNGEATLAKAIESITRQTFHDIKLIISDNASTDATADICRRFAKDDPRIEYIRQPSNIGAEANFDFVLTHADAEYFMWAAADDTRSPDFLSLCVRFLDTHADYVAATCPTRYLGSAPDPIAMADRSLDEPDPNDNIVGYFDIIGRLRVNSRFYSLFRRSAMSFWPTQPKQYLGSDWALVIRLLKDGKFKRLDSGFLELGRHGASKQSDIYSAYRHRAIHWIIPFLGLSQFAWNTMHDAKVTQKARLFIRLACLNARTIKRQIISELRLRASAAGQR